MLHFESPCLDATSNYEQLIKHQPNIKIMVVITKLVNRLSALKTCSLSIPKIKVSIYVAF